MRRYVLDRSSLERYFAGGSEAWISKLAELGPELARHYGWSDDSWRHAMAQIHAETNGLRLTRMRENMRFTSWTRIKEVYSYRLLVALERDERLRREHGTVDRLARFLVGKPELLADVVYGGREGTPWMQGHIYIGRGPTQITHLNNYRAVRDEIRSQPGGSGCPDLVDDPDALEQVEWGVRAVFADWHCKKLSRFADAGDGDNVSSVLNVGSPGRSGSVKNLAGRRRALARAIAVWPTDVAILGEPTVIAAANIEAPKKAAPVLRRGDECEAAKRLQLMLEGLGYYVGDPDGCYDELTERAVVIAQHEHGLPPTGEADPRTLEVLEKSARKPLPRETMTERDLADRGSRTVTKAQELSLWGRAMQWLGLGGGGAGTAELLSPGLISQNIGAVPKIADALTQPHVLKLAAIAIGIGLVVVGWRLTSGGRSIVGYRLEDARTGRHVGR
jgi:predicted chitinase